MIYSIFKVLSTFASTFQGSSEMFPDFHWHFSRFNPFCPNSAQVVSYRIANTCHGHLRMELFQNVVLHDNSCKQSRSFRLNFLCPAELHPKCPSLLVLNDKDSVRLYSFPAVQRGCAAPGHEVQCCNYSYFLLTCLAQAQDPHHPSDLGQVRNTQRHRNAKRIT